MIGRASGLAAVVATLGRARLLRGVTRRRAHGDGVACCPSGLASGFRRWPDRGTREHHANRHYFHKFHHRGSPDALTPATRASTARLSTSRTGALPACRRTARHWPGHARPNGPPRNDWSFAPARGAAFAVCPAFSTSSSASRCTFSCSPAAGDEPNDYRDQCQHEQDVNEPARDMERGETENP